MKRCLCEGNNIHSSDKCVCVRACIRACVRRNISMKYMRNAVYVETTKSSVPSTCGTLSPYVEITNSYVPSTCSYK